MRMSAAIITEFFMQWEVIKEMMIDSLGVCPNVRAR